MREKKGIRRSDDKLQPLPFPAFHLVARSRGEDNLVALRLSTGYREPWRHLLGPRRKAAGTPWHSSKALTRGHRSFLRAPAARSHAALPPSQERLLRAMLDGLDLWQGPHRRGLGSRGHQMYAKGPFLLTRAASQPCCRQQGWRREASAYLGLNVALVSMEDSAACGPVRT